MWFAHLRYTFRSFRKSRGFVSVAVVSLALGIGANTAIFSLLDRVMLRSLPVKHPEQLVIFKSNGPRRGSVNTNYGDEFTFSYPMYLDFRDHAPNLNGVIAWFTIEGRVQLGSQTEPVPAVLVSGNFFSVLGTGMAIGRPIVPDDTRTNGSTAVAVLTYAFWQQYFGGDPGVLNREINVNGRSLSIVGVAERDFHGVAMGEGPAMFVPVTMKPALTIGRDDLDNRRSMWLNAMGRLKPGVSRASAEAALNVFWKPILQDELAQMTSGSVQFRHNFLNRHVRLENGASGVSMLRMMFGRPITVLMALVGLVLLIACANVANLQIARATGRAREIAIRLAVGATRGDIVRPILLEAVILAIAGGAIGVLLAVWVGNGLLSLLPFGEFTATMSADPDLRILGFTAVVSLVCGVLFGLAPAFQTTNPDLASTMKNQAGAVLSSGSHVFLRKGLVIAQMALSLLLLAGAGLFLKSMGNLRHVDIGFRPDHLMSFRINPALAGYNTPRAVALFEAMRQQIAAMPGVRSVAITQTPVLAGTNWDSGVVVPGYQPKEGENAPNVDVVSAGYFAAMGIPLVAGRDLRSSDEANATRVAVVNETFAKHYFGTADAVGRQFYYSADPDKKLVQIVGVAKDGKYADVKEQKQRFVFGPIAQQYDRGIGGMTYYVRTTSAPASITSAIREAVREWDASLPVAELRTMDQQIDDDLFADRIVSMLSAFFGVLATLLASIGLYGVMSYTVTRRTLEIGVRLALGAQRPEVLLLVLREVAVLAVIGIAIGVSLYYPLANYAKSLLYGVAPQDTAVLAIAALVLTLTALAAGIARRTCHANGSCDRAA